MKNIFRSAFLFSLGVISSDIVINVFLKESSSYSWLEATIKSVICVFIFAFLCKTLNKDAAKDKEKEIELKKAEAKNEEKELNFFKT